jgi:SnoaL-like domain
MEAAFRLYFMTGPVHEDWQGWSRLFTDDALYHDHFWGTFRGPSEIERFLEGTMSAASHVYSPLRWYSVGDERVVYEVLNRADHPIEGRAPIEFPSLQVVTYAGEGKWLAEDDWWVLWEMARMRDRWLEAVRESGPPDGGALSRRDWGQWVAWARPEPGHVAKPSWLNKEVPPVARLGDIDFGVRN